MMRTIEPLLGVILIVIVAPIFAFAGVGLLLSGASPVIVYRDVPLPGGFKRHLAFNCTANGFGLSLRRFSIDRLPVLFQVVSGETRFADLKDLGRRIS
ncbi:MAG: hypothetical protein V4584_14005 [Verrucomicrobiota bacterium]